jgi:hypothetical protein
LCPETDKYSSEAAAADALFDLFALGKVRGKKIEGEEEERAAFSNRSSRRLSYVSAALGGVKGDACLNPNPFSPDIEKHLDQIVTHKA